MGVKAKTEGRREILEDFFRGVDQVRTHLSRDVQDPEHRKARLTQIAQDLLAHKAARDLAGWLADALRTALGSTDVRLWVFRYSSWFLLGSSRREAVLDAGVPSSLDYVRLRGEVLESSGAIWLPLRGVMEPNGAIGAAGHAALDAETLELVGALADTAGVLMEMGLARETRASLEQHALSLGDPEAP